MSPGWTTSFRITGRAAPPEGQEPEARMRPVTPGYFRTAGVQLLRGRDISDRDRSDAPGVVVINEAFAKLHFPSEDPIGKRLERTPWWPNTPASFEIVGVIRDERFLGLSSDADPATYFPHAQVPFSDMYVVLKARGDPGDLIPVLRSEIWAVDRDIPLDNLRTMDELVGGSLARPRFVGMLLGLFAAAALLLAAIGIYGVLSYTVAQRTPEIGIRMALGAQQGEVLRSVVGQGMALATLGIILGGGAAVAVTRVLSGMLFGITPTDPAVFAAVAGLLAIVAALAAYIPARKASMVDPLIALRQS
jgi:putative ABC transport system permease protein